MSPNEIPFYTQTALLDRYIHSENPLADPDAVEIILEMLRAKPLLRDYFFRSGPTVAWAPILWNEGFFDAPPPPETTEAGSFLRRWDVQYYLESVATQVPEIAVKHVERIDGHGWYIAQAIRVLCRIPAKESERVIPKISKWLQDPGIAVDISFSVNSLIEKLAEDGHISSASSLFQALTAPKLLTGPHFARRTLFGDSGAGSIFDLAFGTKQEPSHGLELLKKTDLQAVIRTLENNLISSLKIEAEAASNPEREFVSWWRAAIEDTNQDILETYQDRVLMALRDAIETWVQVEPLSAESLVARYLTDKHAVLRRLSLYILSHYPEAYVAHVSTELMKYKGLNDSEIHHEFFLLLQSGFPHIKAEEQEGLISAILNGPDKQDVQDLSELAQKELGLAAQEYLITYSKSWIRDRLWMIRDYLPEQPKQLLLDLVRELGEPEHPTFLRWMSGMHQILDVSPVTEQELGQMSLGGLVDFLAQWQPEVKHQFEPDRVSHIGLASIVANLLLSDLDKYSQVLSVIASLRSEFASAILGRWTNNRQPTEIPWGIAIHLFRELLASNKIYTTNNINSRLDEDWRSVRLSIACLVEIGVVNQDRHMPTEYLSDARDILLKLIDDPDPDLQADRPPDGYSGQNDPITIALKHVRPVAFKTLIEYAWLKAKAVENDTKSAITEQDKLCLLESVVRNALTRKLDKRSDPSRALHSVYGEYLPVLYWLDKEWVQSNIERIFPPEKDEESIWFYVSAWDAYTLNKYYDDLAEFLRPQYEYAIYNISQGHTVKSNLQIAEYLAIHLVFEYLLASYDLNSITGQSSLIVNFFKQTPPEVRKSAAWALWRIYEDNPSKQDEFWPKARALWEWRVHEASISQHSPDFNAEMEGFSRLLLIAPSTENLKTLRPLLEGLLPHIARTEHYSTGWQALEKYLAQQVEDDPVSVIQLYRHMHEQRGRPQWFFLKEEARRIIEVAAANLASRQSAMALIDLFGSWGNNDYRDIYERYST